jgi:hypothetical protein
MIVEVVRLRIAIVVVTSRSSRLIGCGFIAFAESVPPAVWPMIWASAGSARAKRNPAATAARVDALQHFMTTFPLRPPPAAAGYRNVKNCPLGDVHSQQPPACA